jgi:hypothetical protein
MGAMVKMTVRMNQAHRYIARAFGNWELSSPVAGSVYAAKIPDPGRYIKPYDKLNAPYEGKTMRN